MRVFSVLLTALILITPVANVSARDFGGLFQQNNQFDFSTSTTPTAIQSDDLIDCELGVPSNDPDCRELQADDTLPAITPTSTVPLNILSRPIDFSAIISALTAIRNILGTSF